MCLENPSAANNLSSSYNQDVGAEIANAPALLAANQTYSPQYTKLALSNLSDFLGGPNGYLSLYQNQIAPAGTASQIAGNTATRTANVGDISSLIPQMTTVTRTANPQAASLIDTITGNAQNDLNLGGSLNADQTRLVQQGVRAGQAARGLGTGTADVTQEALAQQDYGTQLKQQRTATATGAANEAQSFYSGLIPTILSGQSNPSAAAGLAQAGMAGMAPASMGEFTPSNSLIGTQMNNNYAASEQGAANNNAMIMYALNAGAGAGKGAASAMSSGGGGGGGGMSY